MGRLVHSTTYHYYLITTTRRYTMTITTQARINLIGNNWYYISDTYQASHNNLYTLLMAAKAHGE